MVKLRHKTFRGNESYIHAVVDNARDALNTMGKDHAKTITIKVQELADSVVIRVEDTDPGIPDEIKKEIFHPFFTTKPPGKGTGIGLSIVYRIIEDFGGKPEVEPEEGSGATMIIMLLKPSGGASSG